MDILLTVKLIIPLLSGGPVIWMIGRMRSVPFLRIWCVTETKFNGIIFNMNWRKGKRWSLRLLANKFLNLFI